MKKVTAIFMSVLMVCFSALPTLADTIIDDSVSVYSNGYKLDFDNDIYLAKGNDSAVYIFPVREFLNNIGVTDDNISWNGDTKSVTVTAHGNTTTFTVGSTTINRYDKLDGEVTGTMSFAPTIIDGKMYYTLDLLAYAGGFGLNDSTYDESTNTFYLQNDNILGVSKKYLTKPALLPIDKPEVEPSPEENLKKITAKVYLLGDELSVSSPVYEVNGYIYFPIAELVSNLGATDITSTANNIIMTNKANGNVITFTNESKDLIENTISVKTDGQVLVINDTLYAPITKIAQSLGYTADKSNDEPNTFILSKNDTIEQK